MIDCLVDTLPRGGPAHIPEVDGEPGYRVARAAPSLSAFSLAHAIWGWVRPPKPQSVPAMTFSAPSSSTKRRMRCATSSGCSMPSVACETMPGMRILPDRQLHVLPHRVFVL